MVQTVEQRHADTVEEHIKVIDNAVTKVNAAKEELVGVFKTVTVVLEETKAALKAAAEKAATAEHEKAAADKTIETMTGEQKRLLQEYATLQSDLKRMSSVAKDLGQKEFNFQQVQAVLSIYMVLLEQVWQSQPHFKVLYLLHGQRPEMSRQDLAKASGISAAMILRALFELRNANLVLYDEDTGMAKLVRRFLEFNTDELGKDKDKAQKPSK